MFSSEAELRAWKERHEEITGDLDELTEAPGNAEMEARVAFFETVPTTPEGFRAMLEYAVTLVQEDGSFFDGDDMNCLICNLFEGMQTFEAP